MDLRVKQNVRFIALHLCQEKLSSCFFIGFFFGDNDTINMGFTRIRKIDTHGSCSRGKKVFWAW